jgi:integrase
MASALERAAMRRQEAAEGTKVPGRCGLFSGNRKPDGSITENPGPGGQRGILVSGLSCDTGGKAYTLPASSAAGRAPPPRAAPVKRPTPAVRSDGSAASTATASDVTVSASAASVSAATDTPTASAAAAVRSFRSAAGAAVVPVPFKSKSEKSVEVKVEKHRRLVASFAKVPVSRRDPQLWLDSVDSALVNMQSALSEGTAASYQYYWSRFEGFCKASKKSAMPFSALTVTSFLSFLAESSDGIGGVDAARAALHFYWGVKFPELFCPTDSHSVRAVMSGIKRRFMKPVTKKKPLSVQDFSKILYCATNGGDFEGARLCQLRLAAQVAVMYSTFSRFEEVAALKIGQVVLESGDFSINFLKGKQYQYGEARLGMMTSQPQLAINPVRVLQAFLERLRALGAGDESWLFPSLSSSVNSAFLLNKPASYNCVLKQFKAIVVEAGVEGTPGDYGLHSMRRGAATFAKNNGCDDHTVMKQMRVASVNTVQRYASLDKKVLSAAPNSLFGK